MYVSLTRSPSSFISLALHKTESCIKAIGALNFNADICNNEASNEWIRLGAVAFLW